MNSDVSLYIGQHVTCYRGCFSDNRLENMPTIHQHLSTPRTGWNYLKSQKYNTRSFSDILVVWANISWSRQSWNISVQILDCDANLLHASWTICLVRHMMHYCKTVYICTIILYIKYMYRYTYICGCFGNLPATHSDVYNGQYVLWDVINNMHNMLGETWCIIASWSEKIYDALCIALYCAAGITHKSAKKPEASET